ncbi:aminodeoxychorismate lyase [Ectothiorhodospiraceae bacterium BW-2]|nr:aminodeoxychorismate lyase [Ectothiorhodospiraceae bacterium BW-2]
MAVVLLNGVAVETIAVTDRALHYGDGLFETVRISGGSVCWLPSHCQRLWRGFERLQLPLASFDLAMDELRQLAEQLGDGIIKLIISRGSGGRGYALPVPPQPQRILLTRPLPDYPLSRPARLFCCQTRLGQQPLLAGLKHLNRLEQILARSEWGDEYDEGVVCDQRGAVAEGVMSNLFWVNHGQLQSHPLHDCGVHGVMRQQVLTYIEQQQWPFSWSSQISMAQLAQMEEIFICNVAMGVWPVGEIGGRAMRLGPFGAALRDLWS